MRERFREGVLRTAVDGLVSVKLRLLGEAEAAAAVAAEQSAAQYAQAAAELDQARSEAAQLREQLATAEVTTTAYYDCDVHTTLHSYSVTYNCVACESWLAQ
jgi:AICAR transformylase/IMP cyclohydrolase PurH